MSRYYKIAIRIIIVIVALFTIISTATPPLVKRYIVENSHSLIGRKVDIERLRLNIFTGRLRTENLVIYEADNKKPFVSLQYFDMRLRLLPLMWHRCIISHITLRRADIAIHQNGKSFNFDDIVESLRRNKQSDEATDKRRWDIGIYDILLDGGSFLYTDRAIDAEWRMNHLNLSIPGVYFAGKSTDVGVVLNFAEGGTLATEIQYNMASSDYVLHLKVEDMTLNRTLPYLRRVADLGSVGGRLSMDIDVKGNTNHLMAFSTSGVASISDLTMKDHDKEPVLSIDSLHVRINNSNFMHRQYDIESLYASGIRASVVTDKAGVNNIKRILSGNEQAAEMPTDHPIDSLYVVDSLEVPAPTTTLRIGNINLRNGEINIADNSMHKPFNYCISSIVVRGQDFNLDSNNRIMINAQMQGQGSAMVRWDGDMHSADNHDILVSLSNISLKELSPYVEHMTGYPLVGGNLTFRSQNIITDGYLRGTNHLDMYRPSAEKRLANIKAEMNIPLRLGLYVMTDNRGHVNIDLPVSGHIKSPEFSYRKIVAKALGNLLLKVASSPVSFLFGEDNAIDHIAIDPLQHSFSSEQYSRLDRLAEMVTKRPEISLTLTQRINRQRALVRNAETMLKIAYYNSTQIDSARRMSMLDFESAAALTLKSEGITAFADSLLRVNGGDTTLSDNRLKAISLYGNAAESHLNHTLLLRDSAIVNYLRTAHPTLANGAIRIESVADSLHERYRGSDRYTIRLEVEGESVELSPEEPIEEQESADATLEESIAQDSMQLTTTVPESQVVAEGEI